MTKYIDYIFVFLHTSLFTIQDFGRCKCGDEGGFVSKPLAVQAIENLWSITKEGSARPDPDLVLELCRVISNDSFTATQALTTPPVPFLNQDSREILAKGITKPAHAGRVLCYYEKRMDLLGIGSLHLKRIIRLFNMVGWVGLMLTLLVIAAFWWWHLPDWRTAIVLGVTLGMPWAYRSAMLWFWGKG